MHITYKAKAVPSQLLMKHVKSMQSFFSPCILHTKLKQSLASSTWNMSSLCSPFSVHAYYIQS